MNPALQLRDIHLPAEIGWWPPAYGWWLLLLLSLLLCYSLYKHWRSIQPQQPRMPVPQVCQPALLTLARLEEAYADDPDQLIRELSVLLRRSAISLYGRHQVSGLSGKDWLAFLDQQSDSHAFSTHFHTMLTELPYRETSDASAAELASVVRKWLHIQQDKWSSGRDNGRSHSRSHGDV